MKSSVKNPAPMPKRVTYTICMDTDEKTLTFNAESDGIAKSQVYNLEVIPLGMAMKQITDLICPSTPQNFR